MASRTDKLTCVESLNIDGHAHIFSNPRDRANKWYRDPGSRKLTDLVKRIEEAKIISPDYRLNGLFIVNAGDDWNYERFVSQARDLPYGYGYYQDNRVTQVVTSDSIYTFIKGQEIFTREGHLLVWGCKFGEHIPDNLSLDETLNLVESDSTITKIADHTDFNGGLGFKGSLTPQIAERIDAYELNSQVNGKANEFAKQRAEKDKKPLVYGSDSHRPKYIGYALNIIDGSNLDFSNGKEAVASLKNAVTNKLFKGHIKQMPFFVGLHHVYMIVLDHKLGLLGKDKTEDSFNIEEARRKFEIK